MPPKRMMRSGVGRMDNRTFALWVAIIVVVVLLVLSYWVFAMQQKHRDIASNVQHMQQIKVATNMERRVQQPQQPQQLQQLQKVEQVEPPVYPSKNPDYPLRHQPQKYQQVGVLVSQDSNEDEPTILGLFGKKMDSKDRWEYYVASDKFHMYKLPAQYKNRMCDEDVGCEEIYNGDDVVVPDYANKVFRARIYKYDSPVRY